MDLRVATSFIYMGLGRVAAASNQHHQEDRCNRASHASSTHAVTERGPRASAASTLAAYAGSPAPVPLATG